MRIKLKEKYNSIFTKLIMMAFIVIIPLIGLMTLINFASERIVKEQVINSNEMVLLQYMSEIDVKLDNVKHYIAGNKFSETLLSAVFSHSELEAYNTVAEIKQQFKFAQNLYEYVDGFFIYSKSGDFISLQNPSGDTSEESRAKKCIKEYISKYPEEKNPYDDGWMILYDGQEYLLRCMIQQGDYYIGAWILEDSLISTMKSYSSENGISSLIMTDVQGNISMNDSKNILESNRISDSSIQKKYMVVSKNSSSGEFMLSTLVDRDYTFSTLYILETLAIVVIVVACLLFVFYLLYLKIAILRPINELIDVMNRISSQNLDCTVDGSGKYSEIKALIDAYNSLISRIKKLKIGIYEEKLSKQQTEQQLLQLQIKPHFFLNALNTVLSFMYTKQFNMAEEMVLCIANHFRYILHTSDTIDLIDEIEQTKNYLSIQEKRYEKHFTYEIHADEDLYAVKIPILSIQTFIENSIKYVDFEKIDTKITLTVTKETLDRKMIMICIDDNGDGFDENTLKILNAGKKLTSSNKEHIGIYNVSKRLGYIYGGKATIKLSNNEKHGAHVEMRIPYNE